MPTKIYTDKPISAVSHSGKSYPVKDGQVDVPDEAAAELCESHGFSDKPIAPAEGDVFDPKKLTREQLIEFGNKELGLDLSARISKADALKAVEDAIVEADKA